MDAASFSYVLLNTNMLAPVPQPPSLLQIRSNV